MDLWIKDKAIYLNIQMKAWNYNRYISYKPNNEVMLSYKGIRLSKENRNRTFWTCMYIDIYGMDSKESLKLSRDELTKRGKKDIEKIINEGNQFFIEKLKERIDELGLVSNEKQFDKFGFIMLASMIIKDFKASDYKFLLDEEMKILVMKKVEDLFEQKEISFLDIIDSYPNVTYINIDKFSKNNRETGDDEFDYEIIKNELNENSTDISEKIIIVDKNFIDILAQFAIKKIQYIDSKSDWNTLLYSINNKNDDAMVVNQKTENYLIDQLVLNEKDKSNYSIWFSDNQRNCIPAFSKYDLLAVKSVPAGIAVNKNIIRQMISPITRNDKIKIRGFNNKEAFIESIISREDYKKLIYYTMENKNSEKAITEKQIDTLYKELIGKYFEIMKEKIK